MSGFTILAVDSENRSMVIDWGNVVLNHRVPLYILENPDMVHEEYVAAIESMRPHAIQEPPVPDRLLSMVVKPDVTITPSMVDIERDRRIALGFEFKGKLLQARPEDLDNIAGASQLAVMAKLDGADIETYRWQNPAVDYHWIAADNTLLPMSIKDLMNLGVIAATHKHTFIMKGRAIKDMAEIPANYTDDVYW